MSVYCASPIDGVAWITGMSSGIGYQPALKPCGEGYSVMATVRSVKKLEKLKTEAQGLKGHIMMKNGDVSNNLQMLEIIS